MGKTKKPQKPEQTENNKVLLETDETESEEIMKWTDEDKEILLKALKKYGEENITEISKMLPHIPPNVIESKIDKYSAMSECLYEDAVINKWMKCGLYRPGDSPIAEALLFIQMFENHPSLSKKNQYDFRAIYNVLHQACREEPKIPRLSDENWHLLFSILSNTEKTVWPKHKDDIWEYIGRVYNKRHIWKVYPGKRQSSS